MVSLSKGAISLFLLATTSLTALPSAAAQDGVVDPNIAGPEDPLYRDIMSTDGIEDEGSPNDVVDSSPPIMTVIATIATVEAEASIQDYVKTKNGQGNPMKVKSNFKYAHPQKRKGQGGHGAGGSGGNKEGGGNTPVGAPGQNKKNGRHLEVGTSEETDIGFVIMELSDGTDSTSEILELSALDGVTTVEHDIELHVAEVSSLRGANAANEHVREIMEAMMKEQTNLETEFAPEHQDHEGHHRKLAEEIPYGITMVNVTHLWSIPAQQSVKICVIDTGYDLGHPDLPSAADGTTGWDTGSASYGYWHTDGHSHGTHCAGTIGAIGSNDVGVVGVNNDQSKFTFHIGKGLSNSGSGSGATVIGAVNDCVAAGAKVISMSLGCSNCYVGAYDQAYQNAYDAGVLVIAAAGNSGSDTAHFPSGYKSVMSVASVREGNGVGTANYGELSSFSTRNDQTEIAGPGHYVKSTVPRAKGSYGTKSGTSMAAPHVAGVAAILISHFPDCSNNQIRNAMIHSAREPPTGDSRNSAGWDKYYGWGIVNAGNAYELLKSKGCEAAGGRLPNTVAGEVLSDQPLGGKDQKTNGCVEDWQCTDANLCKGEMKCNLSSNTCYSATGSAPNCDDNNPCTIDSCNAVNGQCVHAPKTCEDGNSCNGVKICEATTGNCILEPDNPLNPGVDCDDGNACTIDKCTTSTGACTHTPKTCDDGNACTHNDHCDTGLGCVFANPEPGCCGNAECEAAAGENENTCAADCSDSIVTTFDTSVARYRYLGSKFNIQAKDKNITIAGVGVHCILPPETMGKVFVYTSKGDYYGNGRWYKKNSWTKVVEQNVVCAGEGQSTDVSFSSGISVGKNENQAFSIYVLTDDIYEDYPTTRHIYHSAGRHAVYKEDSYVKIKTGSGNFCANGWCAIVTPMAYSGSFNYVVVNDNPTANPTLSMAPTTPFPTTPPTKQPEPTESPTGSPTKSPTISPTDQPSTSAAPSEFVPEVVTLIKNPSGWANILRSAYFTVTGSTEWAKVTNMKIVSYRTTGIKVYMKRGDVRNYENAPCSWELIAETQPGYYSSYWKRVYPTWNDEGFTPVIIEPNEQVSFYVSHFGSGYGFLGKRTGSRYNYYNNAWASLSSASPLGAMKMGDGRCGERGKLFKPCNTWYGGYGMFGGFRMETMQPGSTQAPTTAPTTPYSADSITSNVVGDDADVRSFNGVQFDVENTSTENVIATSINVHFATAGTKNIEVWHRQGTHKGGSGTECPEYNNWCKKWTKLASKSVYSQGAGTFTESPPFTAAIDAGATASFVVVSPDSELKSHITDSTAAVPSNDRLTIKPGTCIEDYYGDNVQTSHAVNPDLFKFEGKINYDVVNSKCAVMAKWSWTTMDPNGANTLEEPTAEQDPEMAEVVYEPEEDPNDGDGPVDGDGPIEGGGDGPPEELTA